MMFLLIIPFVMPQRNRNNPEVLRRRLEILLASAGGIVLLRDETETFAERPAPPQGPVPSACYGMPK